MYNSFLFFHFADATTKRFVAANPVVEMDGDEMTRFVTFDSSFIKLWSFKMWTFLHLSLSVAGSRIIWQFIKEKLIFPYVKVKEMKNMYTASLTRLITHDIGLVHWRNVL